jgi:molybdenum cofactor cytidylyltransferase
VQVLVNPDWALGVGNTIKFSLKKLLENNINVQGVMFMVCDQPHISTVHLNNIIDRFIEESPVAVASQYKGTYGVPAIFDRIAFSNLLSISDQAGAKTVLQNWEGDLRLVSFNGGEIDLDTPEEYKQYLEQTKL